MPQHNKQTCPYHLIFDNEEADAIEWLTDVLKAIIEKGPSHRSFKKAMTLLRVWGKVLDYREAMDDAMHKTAEIILTQQAQLRVNATDEGELN